MNHEPPQTLEDIQAERRRRRWGYFLTPFIAMASIVFSIGMLMFFGKSCQERIPEDAPFRTNPLFKQYAPFFEKGLGDKKESAAESAPESERVRPWPDEKSEGASPLK